MLRGGTEHEIAGTLDYTVSQALCHTAGSGTLESNRLLALGRELEALAPDVAELAPAHPDLLEVQRVLGTATQLVLALAYLQGAVEYAAQAGRDDAIPQDTETLRGRTYHTLQTLRAAGLAWLRRLEATSR